MLNNKYTLVFLFFLSLPLFSFGQTGTLNESRMPLKISSLNLTGFVAAPLVITNSNILSEKLLSEMNDDFESSGPDIKPLNSKGKTYPKNIISLKLGADDPWVGISYERLVNRYIGAEVQVGLIGASIGAKLYFPGLKKGKINFYAGALPGWGYAGGRKTYFPIGLNIMTKRSFRISLDAGPRIWHGDDNNFLGFSLKIGKGF